VRDLYTNKGEKKKKISREKVMQRSRKENLKTRGVFSIKSKAQELILAFKGVLLHVASPVGGSRRGENSDKEKA